MGFFRKSKKQENDSIFTDEEYEEEIVKEIDKKFLENHVLVGDKRIEDIKDINAVKDVLLAHLIPETYSFSSDVLFPEDFKHIKFDTQVPKGYDIGQVDAFKEKCQDSIAELVDKLTERNLHIVSLANIIDRLQVDANNARFEAQMSTISIIPTSDSDEMFNRIESLKSENARLKKEVSELKSSDKESKYKELLDKYRVLEDTYRKDSIEFEQLKRAWEDKKIEEALAEETRGQIISEVSDDLDSLFKGIEIEDLIN